LHPGDKVIAIFIDCSDKEVKRRITGRRVCECGASYHLVYNPPKKKDRCDLCGKKLQMREDDKPKVVNDRLKLFHRKMRPLARAFEKYYELIIVDGDKDIGRVKDQIAKKLEKLV
jgi:adenylate kinase